MSRTAGFFLTLFLVTFAACGKPPFELDDITGVNYGHDFALTDHNGKPRTLADLAQTARLLGPDAARFQVLFVTVDPERDTPAVLAKFVPSFNPSFLGLYGDAAATARVAKEFKIVYKKFPMPNNNYTVDHSVGTFIYGPDGQLRLFAQYGVQPKTIAHDVKLLLHGTDSSQ